MAYELRDYQTECHDAVLREWGIAPWCGPDTQPTSGEPSDSTLANLATSAGKTIIAAGLIRTITRELQAPDAGRVMFLADSDELCQQPIDKLRAATGLFAALEKADSRASMQSEIIVASAQTLDRPNRRQRFPRGHFRYAIVDEAHRGSPRNQKIMEEMGVERVLGITATAFRAGMKDLAKFYRTVCYEMNQFVRDGRRGLTELGYLTPLKVLTLPISVDLRNVRQSVSTEGMDYNAESLDDTITPFFEAIAEKIHEHASNRHIIAFLPLVRSSMKFRDVCRANGITTEHVDGNSADRNSILESFARGDFQLLSNSMLLTTGWDCHICDCLLNLRPTRSAGLFRQMVGRIIRVLAGVIDGIADPEERKRRISASAKPDALILDLLWQYKELALANPASLIAANEEEAAEIAKKLREMDDAELLQEISTRVQQQREEQLAEMLRKRQDAKASMLDAAQLAVALHQMTLLEFEPTFRWESKPLSDGQKGYLSSQGIDVESIRNRGHASAIIDALKRRQQDGRISVRQMVALRQKGHEIDSSMTTEQVIEILGDDLPMPFGKHKGRPLSELPAGYIAWLKEQEWLSKWPDVAAYCAAH